MRGAPTILCSIPASVLVATVTGKSVRFAGWEGAADRTGVMGAGNEMAFAGGRTPTQSSAAPRRRADPRRLRAPRKFAWS